MSAEQASAMSESSCADMISLARLDIECERGAGHAGDHEASLPGDALARITWPKL